MITELKNDNGKWFFFSYDNNRVFRKLKKFSVFDGNIPAFNNTPPKKHVSISSLYMWLSFSKLRHLKKCLGRLKNQKYFLDNFTQKNEFL